MYKKYVACYKKNKKLTEPDLLWEGISYNTQEKSATQRQI